MLIKQNLIIIFSLLFCLQSYAQTGSTYTQAQADEMVKRHNYHRAEVGVKAVKWSNKIAKEAQAWADHLASTSCGLDHSDNDNYGENLFWGYGSNYTAARVTDYWASEKKDWKGGKITYDNYSIAGHYTQMIWHTTTEIGCGQATCSDGSIIVVCKYNPAGNVVGQSPTGN